MRSFPLSMHSTLFMLLLLACGGTAFCNSTDEVLVNDTTTQIRTYFGRAVTDAPTLLVALHGDSPFNPPSYQYRFARHVAAESDNLVAVGMLRPGYTDESGRTSSGTMGLAVGDNFDAPRVRQIAIAIKSLKARHGAAKVILAGHSGGSAIAANLTALHPGLVDHAILVSCPADVAQWRRDMFMLTGNHVFREDITFLSPIELASAVPETTMVTIIAGEDDRVTRPELGKRYAHALATAGVPVEYRTVHGEHEIFLAPEVLRMTTEIVNTP